MLGENSSKAAQHCIVCSFNVRETDYMIFLWYCIEGKKKGRGIHIILELFYLYFLTINLLSGAVTKVNCL